LIMVGGPEEVVEDAEPILQCFGTDIIRCGPVGAGETMKLVNNLLTATIVAANAEALVLGTAAGLELDTVLRVLRMTAASNTHLKSTYAEKALRRDFSPGFATKLAVKDLRLALGLAIDQQLPVGVAAAALQLFSTACSQGHADDDYTSVITVLESLAGLELEEKVAVSA
jgi:3-hydroxyisobutyrate dehydrogenase-like beta-hydroxyacid dehydrogenase